MATEVAISWTVIEMAAQGVRDRDLLEAVRSCNGETAIQLKWLKARTEQAAPRR